MIRKLDVGVIDLEWEGPFTFEEIARFDKAQEARGPSIARRDRPAEGPHNVRFELRFLGDRWVHSS